MISAPAWRTELQTLTNPFFLRYVSISVKFKIWGLLLLWD